jgi:hypothetical protein
MFPQRTFVEFLKCQRITRMMLVISMGIVAVAGAVLDAHGFYTVSVAVICAATAFFILLHFNVFRPLRQLDVTIDKNLVHVTTPVAIPDFGNDVGYLPKSPNAVLEAYSANEALRHQQEPQVMMYAEQLEGKTLEIEAMAERAEQPMPRCWIKRPNFRTKN